MMMRKGAGERSWKMRGDGFEKWCRMRDSEVIGETRAGTMAALIGNCSKAQSRAPGAENYRQKKRLIEVIKTSLITP